MADGYDVTVTNLAAFDAAMAEARRAVTEPREALAAGARDLVATSNPPRRSGNLAGSVAVTPAAANRARVTASADYAAVIHWGWPGHGIRRQPWLVAQWLRSPVPLEAVAKGIQTGLDRAAART